MLRLVTVFLALLTFHWDIAAGQQTELAKLAVRQPDSITMRYDKIPFTEVLALLGKNAGIEIRVAPEVAASKTIGRMSGNIKTVTFAEAFAVITAHTPVMYTVVDSRTLVISLKPQ